MSSPLPHRAWIPDPHGPEKVAFAPLSAGDDSVRLEQASVRIYSNLETPKTVIWDKGIASVALDFQATFKSDVLYVVSTGRDSQHHTFGSL